MLAKNSISTNQLEKEAARKASEPELEFLPKEKIEKLIREKRKAMEKAAKALDFLEAAQLRDEIASLKQHI